MLSIENTHAAVCSDAYWAALTVYQSAKLAEKGTGLDGARDELGRSFVRKSGAAAPFSSPVVAAK